jgi:hypothetical protein
VIGNALFGFYEAHGNVDFFISDPSGMPMKSLKKIPLAGGRAGL